MGLTAAFVREFVVVTTLVGDVDEWSWERQGQSGGAATEEQEQRWQWCW